MKCRSLQTFMEYQIQLDKTRLLHFVCYLHFGRRWEILTELRCFRED